MFKRMLPVAALVACLGAGMVPATAATYITVAPPPPRQEVVPGPRAGFHWAPGHWEWNGRRHVWVGGHWLRDRRGYKYHDPRWVERDGRWMFERGNWRRGDRDRDGVPDRMDRRPNNPNRS